mmetsp:Transcript_1773/g.7722  ORF Transcript_1773/g.7722 Transcript_1773/m.7722 type:complete len:119 (-) Transcript_1773:27-383(-)
MPRFLLPSSGQSYEASLTSWCPSWCPWCCPPFGRVSEGATVNTNGAGDALVGGFVLASTWPEEQISAEEAGRFASLVARQRCDSSLREGPKAAGGEAFEEATALMERVKLAKYPLCVE